MDYSRRKFLRLGGLITLALASGCSDFGRLGLSREVERLRKLDELVIETYFIEEAKKALRKCPVFIKRHSPNPLLKGETPAATYNSSGRFLESTLVGKIEDDQVKGYLLHEAIHCLENTGLINREEFSTAYSIAIQSYGAIPARIASKTSTSSVNSHTKAAASLPGNANQREIYPIFNQVETIINEKYNSFLVDGPGERLAYFAQYWKINGEKIPAELEPAFRKVFK